MVDDHSVFHSHHFALNSFFVGEAVVRALSRSLQEGGAFLSRVKGMVGGLERTALLGCLLTCELWRTEKMQNERKGFRCFGRNHLVKAAQTLTHKDGDLQEVKNRSHVQILLFDSSFERERTTV